MEQELSEEKLTELKEAFTLFDIEGSGCIKAKEVGTVLRSVGENPTEAEITQIIDEVDPEDRGIEFSDLQSVFRARAGNPDTIDELREAFRVFDRDGHGYITASELRHVMTNLGERLTDEEMSEMLVEAEIDGDGQIHYDEFVDIMTQGNKGKY